MKFCYNVWQNGWLLEIANMTDPAFLVFEIMRDAGTVIYLKYSAAGFGIIRA